MSNTTKSPTATGRLSSHDPPSTLQRLSSPIFAHLAALGGYILCTLLLLAPLLRHFGTAIPGGPVAAVDGWQNVWNLWWIDRAIRSGANLFYTPYLYHPTGVDLHLQTLNVSNGILVWPVTALFGPIAGYNMAVLLACVLAGMGGYALALHVSRHHLAAFVGGLLFAFSPFHLTKIWDGQLELIALQWLAFYAFFLLRAADVATTPVSRMRRVDAVLAGLFLALIGYTSWYYVLFFAIYSLLFGLLWLLSTPGWRAKQHLLIQMALVATVGMLVLLPILLPALTDVQGKEVRINPDSSLDLILIHAANLWDIWLPSSLHPLWGSAVEQLGRQWHPFIAGWNLSLGYGALALAMLGGVVAWRMAWRWWVLTLAALVLSLGPLLHVATTRTGIYLPYALLLHMPGVGIARRPSHFVVIATLLLAPLAALGLRWLLERVAPSYRPMLLVGVLAVLTVELWPPRWPLLQPVVHPAYASLVGQNGALLDLPPRDESSLPLQAQMLHERPILGGFVSRPPSYRFVKQVPGVSELWAMRPDTTRLLPQSSAQKRAALDFYAVRHIMVHWDLLAPEQQAGLTTVLDSILPAATPHVANEQISLYTLPQPESEPFAYFGDGWYPEEYEGDRVWRWMAAESEIILVNPSQHVVAITLALRSQSYQQPRTVTLTLDNHTLTDWLVTPAVSLRRIRMALPPGEHRLRLQSSTDLETGGERLLSIVLTEARLEAQ